MTPATVTPTSTGAAAAAPCPPRAGTARARSSPGTTEATTVDPTTVVVARAPENDVSAGDTAGAAA